MTEPRLSAVASCLLARQRHVFDYDVSTVLGVPGASIKVRVPTKREQDLALAGAHAYVAKLAKDTPSLKDDPEILFDTKAAFIVAAACRDKDEPEKYPAWPTGEWVHERLTSDQIGSLLNIVLEVRSKDGPNPPDITDEQVEAFVSLATKHAGTDLPDAALTRLTHAYLANMFVLVCLKLSAARSELEALRVPVMIEPAADPDVGVDR